MSVESGASGGDRIARVGSGLGCGAGTSPFGSIQNLGFGAANQWNLGLSLQQNLFTGGRVTAQYRAAAAGKRSGTIGFTAAKAQLTLDVTTADLDAQLADQPVRLDERPPAAVNHNAHTTAVTQPGGRAQCDIADHAPARH